MKRWSETEFSVLIENYGNVNSRKICELLPDRTWKQIKNQAHKLQLTKPRREKDWSDNEISVLREFFMANSKEDLLQRLPERTWGQITHKGKNMGLRRKRLWFRTVGSFIETEKAYIAGIVDGEGSITININKRRWSPLVSVMNTYEELIDWLVPRFHTNKLPVKSPKGNRERYVINVWKTWDVIAILEQIMPFLIVKKRNAELILEFCKLKLNNLTGEPTSRDYEILEEIRTRNSHRKVSFG